MNQVEENDEPLFVKVLFRDFDRRDVIKSMEMVLCDRPRFFRHVDMLSSSGDLPETVTLEHRALDRLVENGLVVASDHQLIAVALSRDYLEYLFKGIEANITNKGKLSIWYRTYLLVYEQIVRH